MPIRLLPNSAFEPAEVETLVQAFESACRGLKFGQKDQALRDAVARKVMEYAKLGERDPERICNLVLDDMQGTVLRDNHKQARLPQSKAAFTLQRASNWRRQA